MDVFRRFAELQGTSNGLARILEIGRGCPQDQPIANSPHRIDDGLDSAPPRDNLGSDLCLIRWSRLKDAGLATLAASTGFSSGTIQTLPGHLPRDKASQARLPIISDRLQGVVTLEI